MKDQKSLYPDRSQTICSLTNLCIHPTLYHDKFVFISKVVTIKTYNLSNCTSCITGSTSYKRGCCGTPIKWRFQSQKRIFIIYNMQPGEMAPKNISRRHSSQKRDPTHLMQNFWSISAAGTFSKSLSLFSHSSFPIIFSSERKMVFRDSVGSFGRALRDIEKEAQYAAFAATKKYHRHRGDVDLFAVHRRNTSSPLPLLPPVLLLRRTLPLMWDGVC